MRQNPDNKMAPADRRKHEDARRRATNYGPSSSYVPATDNPTHHYAPSVDTSCGDSGGDSGGGGCGGDSGGGGCGGD